jgi:small subunit ribosomal protein S21
LPQHVEKFSQHGDEYGKAMAIVTVNQGESIESALRRFKRKVMTEEIIKDAKKHAFFMPPGQKAKLKSALARKRNKKKGRPRPPRD